MCRITRRCLTLHVVFLWVLSVLFGRQMGGAGKAFAQFSSAAGRRQGRKGKTARFSRSSPQRRLHLGRLCPAEYASHAWTKCPCSPKSPHIPPFPEYHSIFAQSPVLSCRFARRSRAALASRQRLPFCLFCLAPSIGEEKVPPKRHRPMSN